MLQKIGFALMCIGTAIADSDSLLIPAAVIAAGALLVWIGLGEEADDETA